MRLFYRELRRSEPAIARGYAWAASRHERLLGLLLWAALFAVLLSLGR